MTLSTKAKEAIKTGLTMAIAYGIALGAGWEIRSGQDPVNLLPAAMKKEMLGRIPAWEGGCNDAA